MDCETIYEANGEVVPMNSLNVNIDNNNTVSEYCEVADENVENMQSLFSKGMTGIKKYFIGYFIQYVLNVIYFR